MPLIQSKCTAGTRCNITDLTSEVRVSLEINLDYSNIFCSIFLFVPTNLPNPRRFSNVVGGKLLRASWMFLVEQESVWSLVTVHGRFQVWLVTASHCCLPQHLAIFVHWKQSLLPPGPVSQRPGPHGNKMNYMRLVSCCRETWLRTHDWVWGGLHISCSRN